MNLKSLLLILITTACGMSELYAQGCVAIRNVGCSGNSLVGENQSGLTMKGDIVASAGYRYFKSFRHFRGKEEEKHRIEEGTEVINYFHALDLGISYGITDRLAATLVLPFNYNDRSSMYEHYGNSVTANPDRKRFDTGSMGLSDVRLSLSYWLIDPAKLPSGNIAIGAGVKLPTGNYKVEGDFHRRNSEGEDYTIRRPVDQSIQLGDGGWGYSLEVQGYQQLYKRFSLFYNGFYMSTPANTNGVLRNPASDPENVFNYFSVADQYAGRVGIFYMANHGLAFSLGSRLEGIPATDLIGKSEGFRRPGYIVSIEPGVSWFHGPFALNANVPIALERNRIKNTQDKLLDRHGDAAFADYVVNVSLLYFIHTAKRPSIMINDL